jgi:hypothetical protein
MGGNTHRKGFDPLRHKQSSQTPFLPVGTCIATSGSARLQRFKTNQSKQNTKSPGEEIFEGLRSKPPDERLRGSQCAARKRNEKTEIYSVHGRRYVGSDSCVDGCAITIDDPRRLMVRVDGMAEWRGEEKVNCGGKLECKWLLLTAAEWRDLT